jgi:hypothetical protein
MGTSGNLDRRRVILSRNGEISLFISTAMYHGRLFFGGSCVSEVPETVSDFPAELAPSSAGLKKPEREGLPPGYRMRADAHYVDQLTTSRSERGENGRNGRRAADDAAESRERRTDRLLAQLTEDLATIGSAAALLSSDASPMARRVSLDLIRIQTWRAAWLLRANGLVDGTHRPQLRARQLGPLLMHLREGFAAECRVAGVGLQVDATDWSTAVTIDETALVAGVTGAVIATLGLIGSGEWGAIRVHASVDEGELRAIDVSQEDAAAPSGAAARFFDPAWTDRPGGWSAGLGAAAAKAAALIHGGDATLVTPDRRGTLIRLALTRA